MNKGKLLLILNFVADDICVRKMAHFCTDIQQSLSTLRQTLIDDSKAVSIAVSTRNKTIELDR